MIRKLLLTILLAIAGIAVEVGLTHWQPLCCTECTATSKIAEQCRTYHCYNATIYQVELFGIDQNISTHLRHTRKCWYFCKHPSFFGPANQECTQMDHPYVERWFFIMIATCFAWGVFLLL